MASSDCAASFDSELLDRIVMTRSGSKHLRRVTLCRDLWTKVDLFFLLCCSQTCSKQFCDEQPRRYQAALLAQSADTRRCKLRQSAGATVGNLRTAIAPSRPGGPKMYFTAGQSLALFSSARQAKNLFQCCNAAGVLVRRPDRDTNPLGQLIAAHRPRDHAQLLHFLKDALAVADADEDKVCVGRDELQ